MNQYLCCAGFQCFQQHPYGNYTEIMGEERLSRESRKLTSQEIALQTSYLA